MEERVLKIINTVLYNNSLPQLDRLERSIHLRENLEFDSINLAELTVRIEDEFNIDIFEEEFIETIGGIFDKIEV